MSGKRAKPKGEVVAPSEVSAALDLEDPEPRASRATATDLLDRPAPRTSRRPHRSFPATPARAPATPPAPSVVAGTAAAG